MEHQCDEIMGLFAAWWRVVVVAEGLVVLLCLAYTGPNQYDRRTGGAGNRLARVFIDDPSWLESFGLLLLISHLVVGALLFMAWASARLT